MFKINYKIFPKDLFKIRMTSIYPSFIGVVNIVFTFAMLVLFITFFNKINKIALFLNALAALYFPLIHPILVYLSCIRQAEDVNDGKILYFDEDNWKIKFKDESKKEFSYSKIKLAVRKFDLALLYLDNKEAYVINASIIEKNENETDDIDRCISKSAANDEKVKEEYNEQIQILNEFLEFINIKIKE